MTLTNITNNISTPLTPTTPVKTPLRSKTLCFSPVKTPTARIPKTPVKTPCKTPCKTPTKTPSKSFVLKTPSKTPVKTPSILRTPNIPRTPRSAASTGKSKILSPLVHRTPSKNSEVPQWLAIARLVDMRSMAKKLGISKYGTKSELKERLYEYSKTHPESAPVIASQPLITSEVKKANKRDREDRVKSDAPDSASRPTKKLRMSLEAIQEDLEMTEAHTEIVTSAPESEHLLGPTPSRISATLLRNDLLTPIPVHPSELATPMLLLPSPIYPIRDLAHELGSDKNASMERDLSLRFDEISEPGSPEYYLAQNNTTVESKQSSSEKEQETSAVVVEEDTWFGSIMEPTSVEVLSTTGNVEAPESKEDDDEEWGDEKRLEGPQTSPQYFLVRPERRLSYRQALPNEVLAQSTTTDEEQDYSPTELSKNKTCIIL